MLRVNGTTGGGTGCFHIVRKLTSRINPTIRKIVNSVLSCFDSFGHCLSYELSLLPKGTDEGAAGRVSRPGQHNDQQDRFCDFV